MFVGMLAVSNAAVCVILFGDDDGVPVCVGRRSLRLVLYRDMRGGGRYGGSRAIKARLAKVSSGRGVWSFPGKVMYLGRT